MGGLAATAIISLCLIGTDFGSGQLEKGRVEEAAEASPDEGLPELLATRQMLFFIPFAISTHNNVAEPVDKDAAPSSQDTRRVQLWVSEDRGQNWRFSAAVSPCRRGFLFRAKHDGEYWFLVRTVDQSGTFCDNRSTDPELRVLVDTQPPILHFDAWRGDGGQICSRWAVDETYLKPGSLEILYRTGSQQPWQTVALDRHSAHGGRVNPDYGPSTVNWCPNAGAQFVQIRAKVVDMAGNTAISHAQVDLIESAPLTRSAAAVILP